MSPLTGAPACRLWLAAGPSWKRPDVGTCLALAQPHCRSSRRKPNSADRSWKDSRARPSEKQCANWRTPRDRPYRSCAAPPYGRRQSRKIAVGGQLRVVVRRQPRSGVLRKDRPASPQPRRRSRSQQRAAHHRHRTLTDRPENEGLCRSSDRRGAFQTRRHSNLEALSRQRGLHAHHPAAKGNQRHPNRRLTNRRASANSFSSRRVLHTTMV